MPVLELGNGSFTSVSRHDYFESRKVTQLVSGSDDLLQMLISAVLVIPSSAQANGSKDNAIRGKCGSSAGQS